MSYFVTINLRFKGLLSAKDCFTENQVHGEVGFCKGGISLCDENE
jgi:hypothetical protein